jgi:hypothetical protein
MSILTHTIVGSLFVRKFALRQESLYALATYLVVCYTHNVDPLAACVRKCHRNISFHTLSTCSTIFRIQFYVIACLVCWRGFAVCLYYACRV